MCTEDSPSGLWRTLGKRVGCKPSGVRIPHPPPLAPEPIEVPGFLLLVAPPDLRPPRVLPAREIATREPAARSGRSRSPPVPSGPSGVRHTGGACRAVCTGQAPQALPPPAGTGQALGGSLTGVNRAVIAVPRPGLVPRETCVKRRGRAERAPGLDPTRLDPEALDDLHSRERRKDLARHKELRTTQTRADAAPARRARRIDEESP